jgi:protein-S-isoprenylcysteine O-methyltransferase Ste14
MLKQLRSILFNHHVGTWFGAAFFMFWIGQRLYFRSEHHWGDKTNITDWLVSLQFVLFVVAYITRSRAKEHARGFFEVFFPFGVAAMPLSIVMPYPCRPQTIAVFDNPWPALILALIGTAIIIAGIAILRNSFSIMTEVREVKTRGIYQWTRHPMYVGSMFGATAGILNNYCTYHLCIYLCFLWFQVYRAMREENKIMRVCPEYCDYAQRVGWIGPIGRRTCL